MNAGRKLLNVQEAGGTGLCVGLDIHLNRELLQVYKDFAQGPYLSSFTDLAKSWPVAEVDEKLLPLILAGVTHYFLIVIESAWAAGLRVYKIQSSFIEQFTLYGGFLLYLLRQKLNELSRRDQAPVFVILDAKRGDIRSTQISYYQTYLSDFNSEIVPGLSTRFNFDAITVNLWLGLDVLQAGLQNFEHGKGAVVVTRTSNPSGTTFQDLLVAANKQLELTDQQQAFSLTADEIEGVRRIIGRQPTACEMMMYLTERFCRDNNLIESGISPIFSVIGSTVKVDQAFIRLRPTGLPLIPGFGAQRGQFDNIMPLCRQTGPLAGFLGILSSSRGLCFSWRKRYGGSGKPQDLSNEVKRAIESFRQAERCAYRQAGIEFPFK